MLQSRRSIPSKNRGLGPALEALEDRSLLSVSITEFPAGGDPNALSVGQAIITGPDANIWFTEQAVWGTDQSRIGRITPDGQVTDFPLPDQGASPIGVGPDGNIWYLGYDGPGGSQTRIGDMTPSGTVIKELTLPQSIAPTNFTFGPDGNLWFVQQWGDSIGYISPSGQVTTFDLAPGESAIDITAGPDGNLWFTEYDVPENVDKIGRITPGGTITEFAIPGSPGGYAGFFPITAGPDGNLWFAVENTIGQITPQGQVTEFALPSGYTGAVSITSGPDGNLWFTQNPLPQPPYSLAYQGPAYIGQITTDGQITEYPVPGTDGQWSVTWDIGDIITGPDGNLWFMDATNVARVTFNDPTVQISPSMVINSGSAVNGVVATFAPADPLTRASDYSATIFWGDGSQTTATVNGNGTFQVSASHLYAAAGQFSATVMLHDLSDNVTTYAVTAVTVRSPQEVWVRQLYQDLLQRPADNAGLAAWLALLARGASRVQVVSEFEASLEYRTKVVENLYTRLLGRPADPAGLAGYVQFLGQGGTAQQVEAAILSSAEYYQKRAGQNPMGFLAALYHDVLGRPLDNAGAMGWGELLALGFSRGLVVSLVLDSGEAQRDEIGAAYQQLLGRPADPAGLNGFLNSLAQDATMRDVIAAIASSDEFFQRY
jgi:streptogramin lyase